LNTFTETYQRTSMEQDEITRRNVAIAEYMGWVKVTRGPQNYTVWETPDGWSHPCLEFEERYDLLMPVVEKITKESNLGFHFFPPFGRDTFVCRFGTERNYVGDTMIEATWKAVSEYVLALKS